MPDGREVGPHNCRSQFKLGAARKSRGSSPAPDREHLSGRIALRLRMRKRKARVCDQSSVGRSLEAREARLQQALHPSGWRARVWLTPGSRLCRNSKGYHCLAMLGHPTSFWVQFAAAFNGAVNLRVERDQGVGVVARSKNANFQHLQGIERHSLNRDAICPSLQAGSAHGRTGTTSSIYSMMQGGGSSTLGLGAAAQAAVHQGEMAPNSASLRC